MFKKITITKDSLTSKYVVNLTVTCNYRFTSIVLFKSCIKTDCNNNLFSSYTSANLEAKRIAHVIEVMFIQDIIKFILK